MIIVFFAVWMGFAQNEEPWIQMTNETYNYSIEYPSGWHYSEFENGNIQIRGPYSKDISPQLTITTVRRNKNLKKFASEYINQLKLNNSYSQFIIN